jgi:hypothetical protein
MFVSWTYWMWTSGNFSVTVTMTLNPTRRYLVTGALVGKEGGDYGQIYISTVCTQPSSDQILCGVRDFPLPAPSSAIPSLGIVEILQPNATRVTVRLNATGGRHRAEGTIFDIT